MEIGVASGIVDGEEDQGDAAHEGKDDGQGREDPSRPAILDEPALVAQPLLGYQGKIQADAGDGAASDEQRLEPLSADV